MNKVGKRRKMASQRKLGCNGKIQHRNLSQAKTHARRLFIETGQFKTPYHCRFCKHYHVGER